MQTYNLIESDGGVELRGGAKELWKCKEHEVIIVGPAETGKTFGALSKLHALMWLFAGSQGVIIRKTYKSTIASVVQTFTKKIILPDSGVTVYGKEKPEWFDYPNGSRVWVGGMDSSDKVLSSERDFIYVNQAEELELNDWEVLLTRATGRAGNAPYAQVFGDCNPSGASHWIRKRAVEGKLKLLTSVHQDNPTLYDREGVITKRGLATMAVLEGLSGVRRQRLLLGEWATAEGAVYDIFNHADHVRERDVNEFKYWYLAQDEGYTNPAVILLVGEDGDGRLHIAREYYERGKLQKDVVLIAHEWMIEKSVRLDAVDAAAAGLIADLRDAGIPAEPHKGRVLDGITLIQQYLKVQDDGRARLTVDPACVNTINEFESYTWKSGKDEPVKENDHALDALRYLVNAVHNSGPVILFGA